MFAAQFCSRLLLLVLARSVHCFWLSESETGLASDFADRPSLVAGYKLLEPRLVESHTTVIIPFDDRVIFVDLLDRAEFSSRLSEVTQALDAISRDQFLARSESGVDPGCDRGGWEAVRSFGIGLLVIRDMFDRFFPRGLGTPLAASVISVGTA